jgi:large subunit ribosomal protein L20
MHGLKASQIDIDRKVLAELAVNDADGFAKLAETARLAETDRQAVLAKAATARANDRASAKAASASAKAAAASAKQAVA